MAEAKKAVKQVETKVKEAAKKVVDKAAPKKAAVKKSATRKSAASKKAPKTSVILQFNGKDVEYNDIIKKAVQLGKKELKTQPKDVKIYVKPEESMAYYVANGGDAIGSFEI